MIEPTDNSAISDEDYRGPVRRRRILVLCLLLALVALAASTGTWWYFRARSQSFRVVMGGGRSSSGKLSICGGNLYAVAGKPAVLFGTVTKPGRQEEFTYVVVFRYGLAATSLPAAMPSINFLSTSEGRKWESRDAISFGGKRIEADYTMEMNETETAVARETLTVGGEGRTPAAGRLFLVNLSADPPTYTQKDLALPAAVSSFQTNPRR